MSLLLHHYNDDDDIRRFTIRANISCMRSSHRPLYIHISLREFSSYVRFLFSISQNDVLHKHFKTQKSTMMPAHSIPYKTQHPLYKSCTLRISSLCLQFMLIWNIIREKHEHVFIRMHVCVHIKMVHHLYGRISTLRFVGVC